MVVRNHGAWDSAPGASPERSAECQEFGVIEDGCVWAAWLRVDTPAGIVQLLRRGGVHLRGLSATRRRLPVVELLVQVEHACGPCPKSLVSSRLLCGCGL